MLQYSVQLWSSFDISTNFSPLFANNNPEDEQVGEMTLVYNSVW